MTSLQPPRILVVGSPALRRRRRLRSFAATTPSIGDAMSPAMSSTQPSTLTTMSTVCQNGSSSGSSDCSISGGASSSSAGGSSTGGCGAFCGRETGIGSSGSRGGSSRRSGTTSTGTHSDEPVEISIHAVRSLSSRVIDDPASSGPNPSTTREGNPSSRAMRAAAAEYCSASPIIGRCVNSSSSRSSEWPERLGASSSEIP